MKELLIANNQEVPSGESNVSVQYRQTCRFDLMLTVWLAISIAASKDWYQVESLTIFTIAYDFVYHFFNKNWQVVDHLSDCMAFGSLKPCETCKGQLVFKSDAYYCTGDISAWTKCVFKTQTPDRKDWVTPKVSRSVVFNFQHLIILILSCPDFWQRYSSSGVQWDSVSEEV